ncbi:HWE histidine kinase domain-containing protein [Geminicoccus harenae]|uniref:HWE histidine kinase domain-containing protein n=1 Tax=Geminicoccus harenae TaxID=2498453 RepID=UPI001C93F973|nr:HWE histidine kinase domain-containing protein [Geminicoccus harenae]
MARYAVLGTPAEPGFDNIVQLAAQVCDASVALVSLVAADHQWFKARIGFEARQTDLDSSVCAFALLEPELLVIPDLTQDERTRNNPLVTGDPHIRFYAGAPFRAATGEVLGSLCVLDDKKRPGGLTEQQAVGLKNLARQVENQLELRQAIIERDALTAQQQLMVHELNHRLKNMFAMIQAIAMQTFRPVTDREPVDAFLQRLHALSSAHDVLLQQNWSAAKLGMVVSNVLGTLADIDRFDIVGPEIKLGPRTVLGVSLLLHELTTNALKYGSLSKEGGRVVLHWQLEGQEDDAELVLAWREKGGPPAKEPKRRGFGSKLIHMGLVGTGGAELRYLPSGLEAEFRAPLAQVRQS